VEKWIETNIKRIRNSILTQGIRNMLIYGYNAILTAVRNHHGASLTGREMTVQAPNTNISVPGAKYVIFVPQLNAQSVTIIGNVVNRGMWFFSNTHVQGNVTNFGTMSGGSLTIGGNVPTGQLTLQGNITNEAPLPRIH
jgi:hypothetical protein